MVILGNKIRCIKCIDIEYLLCIKVVYYIKLLWKVGLFFFRLNL